MRQGERMILVVTISESIANNLKELIEFMDVPQVCIATPDAWRERLGDSRLEALFVGSDLSSTDKDKLLAGVGEMDPNVPIVMMSGISPN